MNITNISDLEDLRHTQAHLCAHAVNYISFIAVLMQTFVNTVILIVMVWKRQNYDMENRIIFMAALCLSNVLYGCFRIIQTICRWRGIVLLSAICKLYILAIHISAVLSIYVIALMSLDMFIQIQYPLTSYMLLSLRKAKVMLVGVLLVCGVHTLVMLLVWQKSNSYCDYKHAVPWEYLVVSVSELVMLSLIIILLQSYCIIIARKQMAKIRDVMDEESIKIQGKYKGVKSLAIMTAVYFICWVPYIIIVYVYTLTEHLGMWIACVLLLAILLYDLTLMLFSVLFVYRHPQFKKLFPIKFINN